MDYDDKSPVRNLLFTIEAKMAYFYKYLSSFEKDESMKQLSLKFEIQKLIIL